MTGVAGPLPRHPFSFGDVLFPEDASVDTSDAAMQHAVMDGNHDTTGEDTRREAAMRFIGFVIVPLVIIIAMMTVHWLETKIGPVRR